MSRGHALAGSDRVTARLWDVYWDGDGVGKHGRGPFATRQQAEACIRAVGFPGEPVLDLWTIERRHLERICKKLKTGIPGRGAEPSALPPVQPAPTAG